MKIHPIPLIISIVLSATVLFGGWFLYQSVALESPLQETVSAIDGVENADTHVNDGIVDVSLLLSEDASLRDVVNKISVENANLLKERNLNINIENEASPALEDWWAKSLFDVAEAMENRKYGSIPDILEKQKSELTGLEYLTEIDESYVYIRLTHEGSSKFIILPRTPAVMEVWS